MKQRMIHNTTFAWFPCNWLSSGVEKSAISRRQTKYIISVALRRIVTYTWNVQRMDTRKSDVHANALILTSGSFSNATTRARPHRASSNTPVHERWLSLYGPPNESYHGLRRMCQERQHLKRERCLSISGNRSKKDVKIASNGETIPPAIPSSKPWQPEA